MSIKPQNRGFVSNFAYPILHECRDAIVNKLQQENIEVRPMICGSMGTQPFYVKQYGRCELPNASKVDKYGFYIPNHPGITKKDILKITQIIKSYENMINPYLQTKKFDEKLTYIKKWVPEFQEFTYPKPIIEHEVARKRCLEIYAKALKKN